MENHAEAFHQAVEQKSMGKNESLNLIAISDHGLTPGHAAVKNDTALLTGPGKALPAVDLYDSIKIAEAPRSTGNVSWASLEGYTLATPKTNPAGAELEKAPSAEQSGPKKANHDALNKAETPRLKGTASWASLEGYTLANP